jgi:hypothetical protein
MALFVISLGSFGVLVILYMSVFPHLARNTPHTRSVRGKYENGEITHEEYEREESLEKNRISSLTVVGPLRNK